MTATRQSIDASSVEEVDRGSIRVVPQGAVEIQPPPVLVNRAPWRAIWGFGLLAIFDIAMNAAAGAAAAHVGAQLNGTSAAGVAIRMGALAGTTKAALLIFREVVSTNSVNMVFGVLLFLITSSFGICPLLVTEISNIVLGETPREYVIAGVVAAIPLFFETIRDIKPKPSPGEEQNDAYLRWVLSIALIGSDALGGYVFARMAANQGKAISNYHGACSAGAVYGTLSFLSRAITGCIALVRITGDDGSVSDIFGVWKMVLPDPIVMTPEEYQAARHGIATVVGGFFTTAPRALSKVVGCFGSVCCCCFACFPGGRQAMRAMREDMVEMDEEMGMEAEMMGEMMAQVIMPPTAAERGIGRE